MRLIRIGGYLHKFVHTVGQRSGFGIIIGDDDRDYFFMPSYMRLPQYFPQLTLGSKFTFDPEDHPRGWRARNITVVCIAEPTEIPRAQASRN